MPTVRRCSGRCASSRDRRPMSCTCAYPRPDAPTARSRATSCWAPGVPAPRDRRARRRGPARELPPATRELCEADLVEQRDRRASANCSSGSAPREDVRLSLVTGNFEPIARLKLARAGLGRWFAAGQGAFGSDSEDRAALPAIARRRAGVGGIAVCPRAHDRDRRHTAGHRLRARRRPALRGGHQRPVRSRRARRRRLRRGGHKGAPRPCWSAGRSDGDARIGSLSCRGRASCR